MFSSRRKLNINKRNARSWNKVRWRSFTAVCSWWNTRSIIIIYSLVVALCFFYYIFNFETGYLMLNLHVLFTFVLFFSYESWVFIAPKLLLLVMTSTKKNFYTHKTSKIAHECHTYLNSTNTKKNRRKYFYHSLFVCIYKTKHNVFYCRARCRKYRTSFFAWSEEKYVSV